MNIIGLNKRYLMYGICLTKDFWENINYSHIDLKNIEAYNIVTNFNVLFEKLYSKFSSIYDQKLVAKINKFYQ